MIQLRLLGAPDLTGVDPAAAERLLSYPHDATLVREAAARL